MLRTSFLCAGLAIVFTLLLSDVAHSPVAIAPLAQVAQAAEIPALPTQVSIPVIGLTSSVVYMGLDDIGNMGVPGPHTKEVGWYKDGTVPGDVGSAVFDAHVVAAFKKLHNVHPGDDVYVKTTLGTTLHFKIVSANTYNVHDLSADLLFNKRDGKWLNLITCAGVDLGHGNYSQRFVASALLVEDNK